MRKPDRYEARAREPCQAAGIDPNSRVGEGRGRPAWCDFRDAARQEHLAREAAEAATQIAATTAPQSPAFQNSPLTIYGRHDDATVAQMKNCMTVGNVVAGVICADGHLGYAQPVGGVIAYEKQISISGVGFDIACGNMAVRLDVPFDAIEDRVGEIAKDIANTVSFGLGRTNDERVEHELFDDTDAWTAADMRDYRQKAAAQLGRLAPSVIVVIVHAIGDGAADNLAHATVGSANHYVDLMRDEEGFVWIGNHTTLRVLQRCPTTELSR